MLKRIAIGAAGLTAFVFAAVVINVTGVVVSSMMADKNKPDPEGKLDIDPQTKSKQEWEAQNGKTEKKLKDVINETATPSGADSLEVQDKTQPVPPSQPESYVRPAPPPLPAIGPGNYDTPQHYSSNPGPSGPGNL